MVFKAQDSDTLGFEQTLGALQNDGVVPFRIDFKVIDRFQTPRPISDQVVHGPARNSDAMLSARVHTGHGS